MFARCGSQMLNEVADDDIVLRHLKDVRGKSRITSKRTVSAYANHKSHSAISRQALGHGDGYHKKWTTARSLDSYIRAVATAVPLTAGESRCYADFNLIGGVEAASESQQW